MGGHGRVALSEEPNDTLYQKTLGINDLYFGTKDYQYPIGNIQMVGRSNAKADRLYSEPRTVLNHVGPAKHHMLHTIF